MSTVNDKISLEHKMALLKRRSQGVASEIKDYLKHYAFLGKNFMFKVGISYENDCMFLIIETHRYKFTDEDFDCVEDLGFLFHSFKQDLQKITYVFEEVI